jgi:hypothetical protein
MENKPTLDRGIIIPIGIGILSILGIVLIGMMVYFEQPSETGSVSPIVTPFKYLFLGTETPTPEPDAETAGRKEILTEVILPPGSPDPSTPQPDSTQIGTGVSSTGAPPVETSTPTAVSGSIFTEGEYDDIDDRITYEGDWVNEFVDFAYGETLFVSTSVGDRATFTFLGIQLLIGYLEDPELGVAIVSIDGLEYPFNQSTGSEWISPDLQFGEHNVIITHDDGDVIILDYILILGTE